MKKNPILCLLLALAMMVSLTACQIEIPGIGTVNINDGSNAGSNTGSHAGGNTGDDMGSDHTIHTGNDNDDSLALLRKNMAEVPDYIFAVAYISSAAGGPDDFELPIQEWVSEAAPELCAQYPFVRNIPRERVVGSGGSLFCVVPRDPNASVAVNRIQWNEKTGGYDNVEVLYRSESGEPILVFACADMGESIDPDTEVIVTNSGEEPLKWYPYYGIVAPTPLRTAVSWVTTLPFTPKTTAWMAAMWATTACGRPLRRSSWPRTSGRGRAILRSSPPWPPCP